MNVRLALLALVFAGGTPAPGENWPQWRGPFFNGSTTETNLPVNWSKTNFAWVAPMPGFSGATPVIWEDTVFVSSPDPERNLRLLCLDRQNGAVRWHRVVATGDRQKGRNNCASPSPVTDGKRVFVLFATGDLAAFDYSGRKLWARDLGKEYGPFAVMWIYGSSPMLYRDKLYVQVLQRSPCPPEYGHARQEKDQRESFLLCLEPQTGTNLWRQVRPTDAVDEAMEAYTTPIPGEGPHGAQIVVAGGDYVTAHRADTGAELWRCAGLNLRHERWWRLVPSPVVAEGLVFACGPKRDPVLAIRDGGTGLVPPTQIAWKLKEITSDCVTPLYYQQRLFVLDGDRQVIACLDPQTGERKWQGSLGVREIFRASPTGADGKIYCVGESGTVVVLSAGGEFSIRATIPMGEGPVRSTIAVSRGQLFLRTAKNLYCVGR